METQKYVVIDKIVGINYAAVSQRYAKQLPLEADQITCKEDGQIIVLAKKGELPVVPHLVFESHCNLPLMFICASRKSHIIFLNGDCTSMRDLETEQLQSIIGKVVKVTKLKEETRIVRRIIEENETRMCVNYEPIYRLEQIF